MEADRLRRSLIPTPAGAFPLREVRLPDADAWKLLRQTRSCIRIGELELRWVSPAPDGALRMAVTVRKKNGSAPLRNRIRRQLRELVRHRREELGGVWIRWSFPPRRLEAPTRIVRQNAMQSLIQAKLVKP